MRLVFVRAVTAALLLTAPTAAGAGELDPRVMVIPVQGEPPAGLSGLVAEVEKALSNGAHRLTPNVSLATASLEETALIVGCDPVESACLDSIAAALNVDQLLIADVSAVGADARIDLIAVTRDTEPVRQDFLIHTMTRKDDLRSLEEAVAVMLEAGEARKTDKPDIVEPPPPPKEEPPPVTTTVRTSNVGPWVTIGTGAALGVIGGVFWTLAGQTQEEIDAAPTETAADLERLESLESTAKTRAMIGNVVVIGGALCIAGGITWFVVKSKTREVQVTPVATADGAGVTLGGVW
jgi:hypothetical protein